MIIDTGERELPPVLCLHSLFLDPRAFDDLISAGAGRFRFIAPEFLGQGSRTDAATSTVTMDACADDVLGLVDQLGVKRLSIVAQSMGGDVAIRIAARRPALVERLVLMGSSARSEPADQWQRFDAFVQDIERDGFTGEIVDIVKSILFAQTALADPDHHLIHDVWTKRLQDLSPNLAHAARGVVERTDAVELLSAIAAETLVISGMQDHARPPEWSDEMFTRIPRAELWRLKPAGHSPMIEVPEVVVPAVLQFLDRARAGTTA